MSSRTVEYTAGEIGRVRVIDDFLPPPDALVPREDNVKVTLSLSRGSVEFFKRAAKKHRVPYQRMIRALVDAYAKSGRAGENRKPECSSASVESTIAVSTREWSAHEDGLVPQEVLDA